MSNANHASFQSPRKTNPKACFPGYVFHYREERLFCFPQASPSVSTTGSLSLYSPNQSDLISSHISELNNNNEFSVAVPVISLNYQFKIITSSNIQDGCCSLTCKVALEMPAWVCSLDRSTGDFRNKHYINIQIYITDLLKLKVFDIQ